MKVLIVSNLFPPRVIGGAEVAACAWACWLAGRGHEVRVLTTASAEHPEGVRETEDGIIVERRDFGYVYPLGQLTRPPALRRAVWHWQDHFGGEAGRYCAAAIAEFQPDVINCHDLQGLGYAVLRDIAASGVPCLQTLHDFGFLCVNMAMFRHGAECIQQHLVCRISTAVKRSAWAGIRRLSFWSPSRALLERYRPHLPPHLEAAALPLPLSFAAPTGLRRPATGIVRLLYVGQVTEIKGVEFILRVLTELARTHAFHFQVVGGGAELERLRGLYEQASWVSFSGRVPPAKVGDFMEESDLLLTPSLWFENSPLVIYQAIHLGLPVLASRTGGLPELVADEVSGALEAPGDVAAWTARLRAILSDSSILARWRAGAKERRAAFAIDACGERVLSLLERTADAAPLPMPVG
ncbi:MAG: glycosyltransferase family 4 protein [Chthoniobacter sp.]|uniref:glycosyltransferase family 4 protein n=1 Tax=Chthoniobacter sp. TaxID=2510640 RepID=UPI0032A4CBF6